LLKDSLGGNSKTTIITCISPSTSNYKDTLSSLQFADRAKHITNVSIINSINESKKEEKLLINELYKENKRLKSENAT